MIDPDRTGKIQHLAYSVSDISDILVDCLVGLYSRKNLRSWKLQITVTVTSWIIGISFTQSE